MAIGDYIYRLKAQSGDATPHDELGVSGAFSGGTISLVDLGGGQFAWQFSSGPATVGTPDATVVRRVGGGGITLAVRMAVTDYSGGSYNELLGFINSTGPIVVAVVAELEKDSANRVRARSSASFVTAATVNTAMRTYVVRVRAQEAADTRTDWWVDSASRVGSTPTGVSTGGSSSSSPVTGNTFRIAEIGTETIQIADIVLWDEELSDAQCAALADVGIRETLDASASATITLSPDPASVVNGGTTQITITRSAAAPAGAGVTYNLTSDTPASATVPASVPMAAGQTTATFDVTGVSVGSSVITATNAADSGETDTMTVNVVTVRKLKLLAHIDALGATAVKGEVFAAPAAGELTGAKIGFFSGASFGTTAESGQAPLEVAVADFGGEALTTANTPVCVWEGTSAAGSALPGSPAPLGSSGVHECTVIEV